MAQLLFLSKRAWPDMQTAIAFLTTRVKQPDVDDWNKLGRAVKYLRVTKHLVLTLEANGNNIVQWWVDASFAVHRDMQSHTGRVLTMGKGAIYVTSKKQKLNTKSSTKAELAGVDNLLPQILWTQYFLRAKGFKIRDNILYQDNQSAMKLEMNGR